MWAAVRALDEGGSLLEQMARQLHVHDSQRAARLNSQAGEAKRHADRIRRLVAGEPKDLKITE